MLQAVLRAEVQQSSSLGLLRPPAFAALPTARMSPHCTSSASLPSLLSKVVKCSHGAVPIQQLFGKEAQASSQRKEKKASSVVRVRETLPAMDAAFLFQRSRQAGYSCPAVVKQAGCSCAGPLASAAHLPCASGRLPLPQALVSKLNIEGQHR